ncbi:MAG TPA: hypothetical protein VII76_15805 [Acidimicrobiales bacterium]
MDEVDEADEVDEPVPGEADATAAAEITPADTPTLGAPVLEPPADPESWTDDEWISWLDATDDPDAPDEDGARRPRHWSQTRSASMLGAAMLGLHEVIYGPHGSEIAIVVDAGGDPPGDDLPEVHLDPEHPDRSEVIVRRNSSDPRPDPPEGSEGT